jgi:uncharacterized surface protein with fasciclin (FAS1) repeats
MKTELKKGFHSMKFLAVAVIAIFIASCNKEDVTFDVASNDAELKKGAMSSPAPGNLSIAEIAISNNFVELVDALSYVDENLDAGLVELFLKGTDQYTVFAPTNEAFYELYKFLGITGIRDLPASLVKDVLFYHVTEGRRGKNSVVPPVRDRKITTLLGAQFTVDRSGVITDIFGQKINIVAADISASNGIVHVVDGVLLPLAN